MEEFICMLSTLFNINKYNYCLKKNSLSGHKFPTLNFLPVSFFLLSFPYQFFACACVHLPTGDSFTGKSGAMNLFLSLWYKKYEEKMTECDLEGRNHFS